jgi:putative aminopeptidase FrvX
MAGLMHKQKLLALVRAILNRPTAPFHEEQVAAEILAQLEKCPHVTVARDSFGNIIARFRRGKARARYAFVSHMDHPGWVATVGSRCGEPARAFFGGVPEAYRVNPKIREFGEFAMWDLPAFELDGDRIRSRACDDLIGCSAIIAMFQELEKSDAECACIGIFTRAEEVGFVGTMHLAQSGRLPKSLTLISVETSAERPPAQMGAGPIVRVGDRTSVFDSSATASLMQVAADAKIPVQRCLMSGGTCEATAFQLYGYRTAGLAIALGNYHNCGANEQIAAEYVSVSDVMNLVKLCTRIAASGRAPDPAEALRKRLEANLKKYRAYF